MKKVAVAEAALIKAESNKEQQKLEQVLSDCNMIHSTVTL